MNKDELRKATPVYSGFIKYFPDAINAIARASVAGNIQHKNGDVLHWDRSKSKDELDSMMRHLLDFGSGEVFDDCGTMHIVKCGWRILAFIQKELEQDAALNKTIIDDLPFFNNNTNI